MVYERADRRRSDCCHCGEGLELIKSTYYNTKKQRRGSSKIQ